MNGMPLETCWALNKRWNNKFCCKVASCWLFLLIHTGMHGSMNIKNIYSFFAVTRIHLESRVLFIFAFLVTNGSSSQGFLFMAQQPLVGQGLHVIDGLRLHSISHTTLGRTPADVRHRDLYLTRHNTHKRQTSIPLSRFEPAVPASDRPQTHALDRAATEIGSRKGYYIQFVYSYPAKLDLRLLLTNYVQLTSYVWSQCYFVRRVCYECSHNWNCFSYSVTRLQLHPGLLSWSWRSKGHVP
jgi:hypothetical protein